jgi:hypothetical protein
MNCCICGSKCNEVLNLGKIKPFTFVQPEPEPIPVILEKCVNCQLVQLQHQINLDDAYRQYWYRSGLNKSMLSSLQNIVGDIESKIGLKENDIVVDIGCNDGSLFDFYAQGIIKIGYDPALNIGTNKADVFINDYFKPIKVKAKVITSIAMFYDLPDPNQFIEDVKSMLDRYGVWVIQLTDLYGMLSTNAFDNICGEHLEYYSLYVLINLMADHDLEVFHVSRNKVNGSSLRLFIGHKGIAKQDGTVAKELGKEFWYFASTSFIDFKEKIDTFGNVITNHLELQRFCHKKLHLLGASTKGNTLIQYYNIAKYFDYVAEVNPEKFGLQYCGIPIISEKESLEINPDLYFVPIWHFKDSIIKNMESYLKAGGELFFPLPSPNKITRVKSYEY